MRRRSCPRRRCLKIGARSGPWRLLLVRPSRSVVCVSKELLSFTSSSGGSALTAFRRVFFASMLFLCLLVDSAVAGPCRDRVDLNALGPRRWITNRANSDASPPRVRIREVRDVVFESPGVTLQTRHLQLGQCEGHVSVKIPALRTLFGRDACHCFQVHPR